MRRFNKSNREEWESKHPSLKGIKFRKEGMDTNGNRISSTDHEGFGKYAGWRKHKDGRYYGQDLYLRSGNDNEYYGDFVSEGKINRIVKSVIKESFEQQDQEYANNLLHIWMNNDRQLYDKMMAIVKMLAKKPSLDVNVLAKSSMLAQFYREIINTAKKSGDSINGNRAECLLYIAQSLINRVAEYKNYESKNSKKKLVKESANKTPKFVYMGAVGDGEWELFEYAKQEGWLREGTTEEEFDSLECFENYSSSVYCADEDEPSAFFMDLGNVVFVYMDTYSNANEVRDMIEDFISWERTADTIGRRQEGSWHEVDEDEMRAKGGIWHEFSSGLCVCYSK